MFKPQSSGLSYPDRVLRRILIPLMALALAACGTDQTAASTTTNPAPQSTTSTSPATTAPGQPTTTVAPSDPPDDLLVVGDWGTGTLPEGAVAGAMWRYSEESEVTAILTTGDNFYNDDAEFIMQPYGWAEEAGIPFWITWGNHDVESETRIEMVNETFNDPPRWAVYEWGMIDVVVIDTTQIASAEQAAFFVSAMTDSEDPTIVAMHHPPYSCSHREPTTDLVNEVVDVLDEDVFLVLAGHDHSYQRFENDDINYVVTGGGGAGLNPIQDCPPNHPELLAGEALHHFLALKQEAAQVTLTSIDVNGETIDEIVLNLP